MKMKIVKRCTVVCVRGSIVEVSERQALALGDFAEPVVETKAPKGKSKKEE